MTVHACGCVVAVDTFGDPYLAERCEQPVEARPLPDTFAPHPHDDFEGLLHVVWDQERRARQDARYDPMVAPAKPKPARKRRRRIK